VRRVPLIVAAIALVAPATASAHAEISPPVSIKGHLQLYSLAVPTEKNDVFTTKVTLTVPSGFSIDSYVPSPGWHRIQQQQSVTWTGGHVPSGEDARFQFLAQPASSKTYTFSVQQTYSDGSIVNWAGSESSDAPAPAIEVKDSLASGTGTSLVAIIALVVAIIALVAAGIAMVSRGGRPLA
jgi:uncharacterized protein YcnI